MPATLNEPEKIGSYSSPRRSASTPPDFPELDKFLEQWPKHYIHAVIIARRGKLLYLSAISLGKMSVGWTHPFASLLANCTTLDPSPKASPLSWSVLRRVRESFRRLQSSVIDFFP